MLDAILPLILVGITILVGMVWSPKIPIKISVLGILFALVTTALNYPNVMVMVLVRLDKYGLFYIGVILVSALGCLMLSDVYLSTRVSQREGEEFELLLLSSTLGAMLLVSSINFASLFLGMELMSVPIYGMVAYLFREQKSIEAGIKYMVLSTIATALLLLGMSLLFAAYGTLDFKCLWLHLSDEEGIFMWTLIGLMVIGMGFKLSLVPFHMWTPDVYDGAPVPVSAYLATVSKLAVFTVLMRFLILSPNINVQLNNVIVLLAILSILIGNLLALNQQNIKRMLGYSSVANLGYLLTAVAAIRYGVNSKLLEIAGVYLTTYVVTCIGAFGVITLVSQSHSSDPAQISHYRGLFWHSPYLALAFTLMMMSMSGIPMTAGFIGKFYVLTLAIDCRMWWLTGAILLGSACGLYYYLRVIVTLYMMTPRSMIKIKYKSRKLVVCRCLVLFATISVLALGIYPIPLISLVQNASASLLN